MALSNAELTEEVRDLKKRVKDLEAWREYKAWEDFAKLLETTTTTTGETDGSVS